MHMTFLYVHEAYDGIGIHACPRMRVYAYMQMTRMYMHEAYGCMGLRLAGPNAWVQCVGMTWGSS